MADYFQGAELAAETAIGFLVANEINNVQSKYNDLATDYFNLYQTQRQFYYNNFQLNGEAPFATEQFGITFYAPDYTGTFHTGYFPPGAWFLFNPEVTNRVAALGTNTANGYWADYANRYTPTSIAPAFEVSSTFATELASILDDWNSYMNRYEEHKRDVFNERRWANRMGSLSYGVKEAYTVERGLGTAFGDFDEAQGHLISADATLLNGLSTFAGYRSMQKALREDLGTVPEYQNSSFLTHVIPNV
jgi:hypothetical protein